MKIVWIVGLMVVVGIMLAGCNIGNAPEPMEPSEVKSAVEQLPPEKQIEWYQRSPLPPAEKQAKINEIKQKAGMPIDEGPPPAQGAPTVPSSTGSGAAGQ